MTRQPGPVPGPRADQQRFPRPQPFAPPAPCPVSFVGFIAITAGSDFSFSFIAGFGHTAFPARAGGALHLRSVTRSPGSRTRSVHACWGLRPRRTGTPLAITRRPVLPSGCVTPSAPGICFFRGSMASLHDPLPTLRPVPHGTRRTARGRCDSLRLHRRGLAPPTPCRSPGALRISRHTENESADLPRNPRKMLASFYL
jgi:hypothetical protein